MSSHRKVSKNEIQRLRYSLDTLTDGSEHTGHGSIFLTVSKGSIDTATGDGVNDAAIDDETSTTILARYALSGLCTLTSRLAADQNFKLSPVRAVFCASRDDVSCISGIPSLLLSLANYSSTGELYVVGDDGMDVYVDEIASAILTRRRYPQVLTCVVPPSSSSSNTQCWWKVYDDEYIMVYGKKIALNQIDDDVDDEESSCSSNSSAEKEAPSGSGSCNSTKFAHPSSSVAYIVTLVHHSYTFTVLPPKLQHISLRNFLPLPEEISQSEVEMKVDENKRKSLDFMVHINPRYVEWENDHARLQLQEQVVLENLSPYHFYTAPNHQPSFTDEGILIRAIHQSRTLNEYLPFAFPLRKNSKNKERKDESIDHVGIVTYCTRLQSCTSINLNIGQDDGSGPSFKDRKLRIKRKLQRNSGSTHDKEEECNTNQDDNLAHFQTNLRSFYSADDHLVLDPSVDKDIESQVLIDSNEIDLSDDGDSVSESLDEDIPATKRPRVGSSVDNFDEHIVDTLSPHLLVLGTGCASPAPLRGSSGYAILLPELTEKGQDLSLSVVLECGEGHLTMLGRHLPMFCNGQTKGMRDITSQIRLIWISHSHLDHYGDLPVLIDEIWNSFDSSTMCTCYTYKGRRSTKQQFCQGLPSTSGEAKHSVRPVCKLCSLPIPPIVVAPTKVLRFLDITLNCKNGLRHGQRLYVGVNHKDFDSSPFSQKMRDDVFGIELKTQDNSSNQKGIYWPIQFLKNIPVEHCPNAYSTMVGLRTPSSNGNMHLFTLCYSGDTRPSANIVRACANFRNTCKQNVSLLLHEATFDDDDIGKKEAIRKRHSTVKEAISVAKQVVPDSVLLSHFSQRYPKLAPGHQVNGDLPVAQYPSASAYDGMLIKLTHNLSAILPTLGSLCTRIISNEED